MLSSGVRTLLLWLALIAALALIAVLFRLGHLDPAGPLGPLGIGVSFFCSLVALVALIGLAGGSGPVSMIVDDGHSPDEAPETLGAQVSFGTISIFASVITWGVSVFLVLCIFRFTHALSVRGLTLCLGLIVLSGCASLVAAMIALVRREPRLVIPCLGALISLPVIGYGGFLLVILLDLSP